MPKYNIHNIVPCIVGSNYAMRLRGNEEYCPKEIESKEL